MPHPTAFGDQLRRYRELAGLTQEQLAEQSGLTAKAVGALERGERQRPYPNTVQVLATALKLSEEQRAALLATLQRHHASVVSHPPALPPQEPPAPRLPRYPTPFVGRDAELATLDRVLRHPYCRLVTIVGPGGTGKTRLALEAAARAHHFSNGAAFVALAPIRRAEEIVPAIVDALGITLYGNVAPATELRDYLRHKHLLLVLDNMEHVLEGADLIASLGAEAPQVTLLVTSRERLNLQSEWVVELAGLPVPPDSSAAYQDTESAAVTLFAEHAGRVQHDFQLSTENYEAVVQICRSVDGMPLGIELAASWVRMLSCAAIAAELGRSLDLLHTTMRDVPARHRSLQAVVEQSWNLLNDGERAALRKLSVFRGGFTREAAQAVAGATLQHLLALVDKSLLRRVAQDGGRQRYDMHEVVRHYAVAQLAADPDEERTTRDQHGHYYAAWLVARETPLMKSAHQTTVVEEFRFEIDNLRSAWDWLFVQRTTPMPWRAINCFGYFLEVRCWYREGIAMYQRAIKALEDTLQGADTTTPAQKEAAATFAFLLGAEGLFLCRIGQNNEGQALLRHSITLLRTQPDQTPLYYPLMFLGYVLTATGAYGEAQHLLEESLQIARAIEEPWCSALALMVLGQVAHAQGRLQEAHDLLQDGQTLLRATGEPRTLGMCLTELSAVLLALKRYDEAHTALQESLALSSVTGNRMDRGEALNVLGRAVWAEKQDAEAIDVLRESLALSEEIGYPRGIAQAHLDLGAIAYAQGEHGAARQHWNAALQTACAAHLVPSVLDALSHVAVLLAHDDAAAQVLEICAYILHHPAARYDTRARAAQIAAHQRALVPPEQAAAAEERGQADSLEAAIAAVRTTNRNTCTG